MAVQNEITYAEEEMSLSQIESNFKKQSESDSFIRTQIVSFLKMAVLKVDIDFLQLLIGAEGVRLPRKASAWSGKQRLS